MRYTIILLLFSCAMWGQKPEPVKIRTIPLDSLIKLTITKKDANTFSCYNYYQFKYDNGKKTVKASFIIEKSIDKLKLEKICYVKLCRNIEFCDIDKDGKRTASRGCYTINGIYDDGFLDEGKKGKHIFYNFDEYSKNPVLKLCSSKK